MLQFRNVGPVTRDLSIKKTNNKSGLLSEISQFLNTGDYFKYVSCLLQASAILYELKPLYKGEPL